jgi:hypothetical protein
MAATTLVSPEDENLHPPSTDPLWSESLYLNFSDSAGVLGGFVRLALHPAKKESEGLVCVYLPTGGIGITLVTGELEQRDPHVVRAANLEWECVRPLECWRVRYHGKVQVLGALETTLNISLDLEIKGLHAPFFYPGYRKVKTSPPYRERAATFFQRLGRFMNRLAEIRSALRMRGGRHYEQSMRIEGTMKIGTEEFPFAGSGHRDHSWGLRDWMPSHRWRWLTGQMDDFAFNAMYLTIAGTHVINGYVWHDGRCDAVDDLQLDYSFDETGMAGRDICAVLTAGGQKFVVTGFVDQNVPLPIKGPGFSTMYNIGRTRYRFGNRVGYGVAEFLERLEP